MFSPWQDPESGIVSYILTERVAPVQQNLYFTNSGVTADGKFLWFEVAYPPSPRKMLARVSLNPEKPEIRTFPQTFCMSSIPMVSPDSSGVYFSTENKIHFMDNAGNTRKIGELPVEFMNHRYFYSLATHLSLTADGKYLVLDSHVGNMFVLWICEVNTGEVKILHEFGYMHNHAQASPTDPDMILLPKDWMRDPVSGQYIFMEQRLWITNVKQTYYRNINPEFWEHHDGDTAHEWWSKDGIVCYVNYQDGIFEINPYTLEQTHVWKRPLCHAHCDPTRTFYCADQSPYNWQNEPLLLLFYNREKGIEKKIVSAMPKPPIPRMPYHLDPHPGFSPDGVYITYLTKVLGNCDLAVTPVAPLV